MFHFQLVQNLSAANVDVMVGGDYKLLLLEEYTERRQRNPLYSRAAFSKSLGVSPATLSQVVSGKRPISKKMIRRILERGVLSLDRRQEFLRSVFSKDLAPEGIEFQELDIEKFHVISNWQHYAILSLGDISPNYSDSTWISRKLGISPKEASEAFSRLLKLGLIKKKGRGFCQSSKSLTVPTRSQDIAIRNFHKGYLKKAEIALDTGASALELYSSITMAIDEKNLERARQLITEFRRKICHLLENGQKKRVYTLAVQLFPISTQERQQ